MDPITAPLQEFWTEEEEPVEVEPDAETIADLEDRDAELELNGGTPEEPAGIESGDPV